MKTSRRLIAGGSAAILSVGIFSAGQHYERSKHESAPTALLDVPTPNLADPSQPVGPEPAKTLTGKSTDKPKVPLPKRIPRDRTILDQVTADRAKQPTKGHFDFPQVKRSELLNIDLKPTADHVQRQYTELKKEYGNCKDKPITVPSNIPVYTYFGGKAVALAFTYWPGETTVSGSETIDMPEGADAQQSDFYVYVDGQRHQMKAEVTSPDPVNEPDYLDDITLHLPSSVEIPPKPIC